MGGLSSIDEALENAEVLRKLDPEDPLASDAQLTNDCAEVGRPELEPALYRLSSCSSLVYCSLGCEHLLIEWCLRAEIKTSATAPLCSMRMMDCQRRCKLL